MRSFPRLLAIAGLGLLGLLALPVSALQAGIRDEVVMTDAVDVLDGLPNAPFRAVPPALLRGAQGLVIIPGLVKGGLGIAGRYGRGVLLTRSLDGSWGRPEFISLTGGSIGWQVGVQSTDVILVFKTRRGLDRMQKGKLTLGADIAVAVGPSGAQAEAGTDARLEAEIYSYSRSRGLFAGLAIEGGVLLPEPNATATYYRDESAAQLAGRLPMTPPSVRLQLKLAQLTMVWVPPAATPGSVPAPPPPSPAPRP